MILALSASLTAFHAMADCLGEICTGERVINSYNEVSSVIAIDGDKVVTRNSYSTLRSYSPSELSDEVTSSEFPAGKLVLDEYNVQGTVNLVFRNGKILYRRAGYSSDNISTNLSPEIEESGALKSGVRIIDEYNVRGSVNRLFKNGIAFYRRDGYSSDNSTQVRNLVIRVDNIGELSRNIEIIDEYNVPGKVTDLYQDGRIFYRRNGYSSDNMVSGARSLVLKVESIDGLSSGTSIIDEYNVTGRVTNLYKDGRVFYRRSGYSSDNMTSSAKLVKEVASVNDIKAGTNGIDEYNVPGSVTNCFADGRLLFRRNGYSSSNVVTKVYPEVAEHKVYKKDHKYASNNQKIAAPSAFYSNGMVLHAGTVTSDLFEEVENFEGISKDTDLYNVVGKSQKAKEIYANGVIALEGSTSKIVSYKTVKDKESVLYYQLNNLQTYVQVKEQDEVKFSNVFTAEDVVLVKADLISYLKKNDNIFISKDIKKKIIDLLVNTSLPGESEQQDPEEYSLSITPAEIIDEVKAVLDQEQKKYIIVSPAAAKSARKSIIIDISKSLLKTTCSVVIKERGVEIKNISKKIGKKDTEECLNELK